MNTKKAEQILKKYGIVFDFNKVYKLYNDIKKNDDPLSEEEHRILFDTLWFLGNQKRGSSVSLSLPLKLKLIRNRKNIGSYHMLAQGHIEGGNILSIIKQGGLNESEEAEVWNIFHKLWHHDSARDCDEINRILGTYKIVKHKLKWFRKIKVLDVGCGKNGNGISTLTAKYAGKVKGFGIDLDVQEHPSNVELFTGSVERLPFEDNSFEVVYSSNVIYYFKGKKKIVEVMKEILRVLKSRGMFVFDDNSRKVSDYKDKIIPSTGVKARVLKDGGAILIVKY